MIAFCHVLLQWGPSIMISRPDYLSRAGSPSRVLLSALFVLLLLTPAAADETDQFTLPTDQPFADLGDYFNLVHYRVLEEVVEDFNRDVERALRVQNEAERERRMEAMHDPGLIADRVRAKWGPGFFEMRALEDLLHSRNMRETYPDQYTAYRDPFWIYFYTHLPIDPRKLVLLFQASTVKAYGVYFGTDKWGHFHDLGHFYFSDLHRMRGRGMEDEEALRRIVHEYSQGPISEATTIGLWATGVYSNADLASNYAGMLFYQNLREPVELQGETHEPLMVRIGPFLALNKHVRPESAFLKPFITDHWNEALNPNLYEWGMRGPIRSRMEAMADDILKFYCDLDGRPRSPEYFNELAVELSTYFGKDYGHSGIDDRIITIGDACFPESESADDDAETDETPLEQAAAR
ncbi:MAG: hypothetical protein EA377_09740 [Phycisphaerales bacterium]|nr:MAG: hypothetical protein EA377_09740 [Phycisphaerales bacterium]